MAREFKEVAMLKTDMSKYGDNYDRIFKKSEIMPDISMCPNSDCPKSNECYRYRAIPNEYRQSYMRPEFNENGCDHFWQIRDGDRLTNIEKDIK